MAFPEAEIVDGGAALLDRARRIKTPEEVEAIRAVGRRRRAGAGRRRGRAAAPGITERQLTGVFMEAMAVDGVTTPATQDVAWRHLAGATVAPGRPGRAGRGRRPRGLRRRCRAGGYIGELGRTWLVGRRSTGAAAASLFRRADGLRDRLLDACAAGAPATALLDAYAAAGEPPPPVPVARGLGLGFDLPLVTAVAAARPPPSNASSPAWSSSLTAHVWDDAVGSVLDHEPVVITPDGPEVLLEPHWHREP